MAITQKEIENGLSNMLVTSLEFLKDKNPALCQKVNMMFAKTTKWQRDLDYDELVIFHKFIEDNANETDPTKWKYGQTSN